MYGLELIGIVYGSGREFWASFDRGFVSVFALYCLRLPGLEESECKTLNPKPQECQTYRCRTCDGYMLVTLWIAGIQLVYNTVGFWEFLYWLRVWGLGFGV